MKADEIEVLQDILTDHELCWKQKEVLEKTIAELKQLAWHDLRQNPDDLPPVDMVVECVVYGSDVIICEKGETAEEAVERIQREHYTTTGYIDEDGLWDSGGYPMMVRPSLWRHFPEYEE